MVRNEEVKEIGYIHVSKRIKYNRPRMKKVSSRRRWSKVSNATYRLKEKNTY